MSHAYHRYRGIMVHDEYLVVRRHRRLGSAIVGVWCFETFAALANGEQDARRDSFLDL